MKGNVVPLVVTYNPNFENVSFLIFKNLLFVYADPKNFQQQYLLSSSEVLGT